MDQNLTNRLLDADRRRLLLPCAVAAYGVAYIAFLALTGADTAFRSLVANVAYIPVGVLTAFLAWRVSTHPNASDRTRAGWRALTVACVLTVSADIWWTVDENLLGLDPANSWSNLLYLAYYVALLAGLARLPDAVRSRDDAVKFCLDAATVVVGGGMLVWHFVI